jgi:hypothetical protein
MVHAYVIMHTMIIEREHADPKATDMSQGPLAVTRCRPNMDLSLSCIKISVMVKFM